ncbi:MAG: CPBP family intramembrane metalloprotease [Bacteroidales bacterium]|nr:CPBP family intramembrane metalloprotease [Bacteroidales bacterium]
MKKELWRTIKLFLLWWLLFLVPLIVGIVICLIVSKQIDFGILDWSMLTGNLLIVVVFLSKRYVKLSFGRIERRMVWPMVGMSVLIATAYLFVEESVGQLFFPEILQEMAEDNSTISGISGILYGCIFGPAAEEIGFRGVLLGGLLKTRCRPWLAILISAIAFGLLHKFPLAFFGSIIFGIIVGWLYWRTGSIIPGIIIHIVNNSLTAIDTTGWNNTTFIIILVVSLLLLAFGLWWFGKKCKFADEFDKTKNNSL